MLTTSVPLDDQSSTATGWSAVQPSDSGDSTTGMEGTVAKFTQKMKQAIKVELDTHHGPAQVLKHHITDTGRRVEFAEHLWSTYPEPEDTTFQHGAVIPGTEDHPAAPRSVNTVHVAALGYTSECTLKPLPTQNVCDQIAEEVLIDGFVTNNDPLIISQPEMHDKVTANVWPAPPNEQSLPASSLGYIKGMARSCTILMILCISWLKGWFVRDEHPQLFASVLRVHVSHLAKSTKRLEALANMKLSSRGAIRRPPNVISVVVMCQNLAKLGDSDAAGFIREWNSQAAKHVQILGGKAVALRLLLEQCSASVLDTILTHVSSHGWDSCCWSEESTTNSNNYTLAAEDPKQL